MSVPGRRTIAVAAENPTQAIETVILTADQPAIADEAARPPLTGVAAAPEWSNQGKIWDEQAKYDEYRHTALLRDPEEYGHDDQDDADGCTLSDTGRPTADHRPTLMANRA
ncbi:hypothetical protein [Micromonospora sp. CPCC 206061]|uniref:hypothetical protein n=1 Tax=Micromonospora sp. CPCC 206061 TaxID=3122410 RepID=UPI002FF18EDA